MHIVGHLLGYLNSREMFLDISEQLNCRGFTDIQRAARYFVKMRLSFGADGRILGCNKKPLKTSTEYLIEVRERLFTGVVIEHNEFQITEFCETDPNYFDCTLLKYRVLEDHGYKDNASDFEKEAANKIKQQNETGAYFDGLEVDHGKRRSRIDVCAFAQYSA